MSNLIAPLARSFISRAKAQNMKGAARDRAAMEFFCGAIASAELHKDQEGADKLGVFAAMLISVRGYAALVAAVEVADRKG